MQGGAIACGCGAKLKITPELASAGAVKCPKCGSIVALSGASDSSPRVPNHAASAYDPGAAVHAIDSSSAGSPSDFGYGSRDDRSGAGGPTKPCPYCSELILASAVKCRYCGEFLEGQKPAARRQPRADKGDEPNPAEYFVAIVLAPLGLIIGCFWLARRLPKAKRMLQASALSAVIVGVGALLVKTYVFPDNTEPTLPREALVAPPLPPVRLPTEDEEDGRVPMRRPAGNFGGVVKLDGQPPHVQRAMRANVSLDHSQGQGSGVVVQRDGDEVIILTNRHVIDPKRDDLAPDLKTLPRIRVSYYDDQSNPGQVLWVAPGGIDLAIVKARAPRDIEPVPWSARTSVAAGQEVFAVGNPVGLGWTYTRGVVSALRELSQDGHQVGIVQTDTKITFGNSGGGLYSQTGELIGINTAIVDPSLGSGLGFAIRPHVLAELKPPGLEIPQ
jgi:S1-C subfamily serine protease